MEASQIQHGEPRRLVMSAPTPLRQDFDASQLRGLARKTKDGPQARRLLALAAIYDGATRTEAAKIGGVGLQIIRDWVLRFNARGPDGLLDGKSTGQPSKLNDTQRQAIAGMIESGPIPAVHGVVRWRLIDLAQWKRESAMSNDEAPAARYRRLVRECLEVAHTFPNGERRTVLLQMAQVWQRLSDEYAASNTPLFQPIEGERPPMQQQQQIRPKDDKKE